MGSPNPDRELLSKFLVEEKRKEQGETLSVLDVLRRTRKARGGSGVPLDVPVHLKGASHGMGIVITDADLKEDTPITPGTFREKPVYSDD